MFMIEFVVLDGTESPPVAQRVACKGSTIKAACETAQALLPMVQRNISDQQPDGYRLLDKNRATVHRSWDQRG